jgi:hypothetical protein
MHALGRWLGASGSRGSRLTYRRARASVAPLASPPDPPVLEPPVFVPPPGSPASPASPAVPADSLQLRALWQSEKGEEQAKKPRLATQAPAPASSQRAFETFRDRERDMTSS